MDDDMTVENCRYERHMHDVLTVAIFDTESTSTNGKRCGRDVRVHVDAKFVYYNDGHEAGRNNAVGEILRVKQESTKIFADILIYDTEAGRRTLDENSNNGGMILAIVQGQNEAMDDDGTIRSITILTVRVGGKVDDQIVKDVKLAPSHEKVNSKKSHVYRVRDSLTGMYITKYKDGGYSLRDVGAVWKEIKHLKNSIKNGVLGDAMVGRELFVEEYEVEERFSGKFPIEDIL